MAAHTIPTSTPKNRVRPYVFFIHADPWRGGRYSVLRLRETGGYLRLGSFNTRETAARFVRALSADAQVVFHD